MFRSWIWGLCSIALLTLSCSRKFIPVISPPSAIIDPSKIERADSIAYEQHRLEDSLAEPYLILALKRTGCYGKCPVFEANVFSDGKATYKGIDHVEMLGNYEASADSSWRNKILEKALLIGYFTLSDSYPTDGRFIPNLPNTITSLSYKGRLHRVYNNFDAPKALVELEIFLETALSELNWTKVEK